MHTQVTRMAQHSITEGRKNTENFFLQMQCRGCNTRYPGFFNLWSLIIQIFPMWVTQYSMQICQYYAYVIQVMACLCSTPNHHCLSHWWPIIHLNMNKLLKYHSDYKHYFLGGGGGEVRGDYRLWLLQQISSVLLFSQFFTIVKMLVAHRMGRSYLLWWHLSNMKVIQITLN